MTYWADRHLRDDMTDDLIERLTQPPVFAEPGDTQRLRLVAQEAAAEITRLNAVIAAMRANEEQQLELAKREIASVFDNPGVSFVEGDQLEDSEGE